MGNRVLALGAHPDDVEFMCSGTLKLLGEKGCEIMIGVVADGEEGIALRAAGPEGTRPRGD